MLIGRLMCMIGAQPQELPSFSIQNLLSWWSHKQKVTVRSSTEAEYRSIAQTSTELTWIYTLLTELQVSFTTPVIFCDNQSAVSIAHNPVFH